MLLVVVEGLPWHCFDPLRLVFPCFCVCFLVIRRYLSYDNLVCFFVPVFVVLSVIGVIFVGGSHVLKESLDRCSFFISAQEIELNEFRS